MLRSALLGLALCCSATESFSLHGGWTRYVERAEAAAAAAAAASANMSSAPRDASEQWFNQTLDHFDRTNHGSFSQRFFYNASFFDGTGPVFLCVGGEGPPLDASVLVASPHCNDMVELAPRVGALMLAIEHRYYGQSVPRVVGADDGDDRNDAVGARVGALNVPLFRTWQLLVERRRVSARSTFPVRRTAVTCGAASSAGALNVPLFRTWQVIVERRRERRRAQQRSAVPREAITRRAVTPAAP